MLTTKQEHDWVITHKYIIFPQVNNAALVLIKTVTEHTTEDCSMVMNANFESPYHLCQLAYPLLKESENGNVVFISSVAGTVALPLIPVSAYAASKGMVNTAGSYLKLKALLPLH